MHPHPHSQPPSPLTAHLSPFTPLTSCNLAMGMTVTPAAAAVVVSAAALPLRRRGGSLTSSRAHPDLSSALLARCSPLELEGWSKVPVAATETRPLSDFYPGAPPILFAVSVSGWLRTGLRPTQRAARRELRRDLHRALLRYYAERRTAALPPSSKTAAVA